MSDKKGIHYSDLGWSKKQYDAAQSAVQGFFRGRRPKSSFREIITPGDARGALETAKNWQASYERVILTGEFTHPESGKLIKQYEVTSGLRALYAAILRLNKAVQRNLLARLKEMEATP